MMDELKACPFCGAEAVLKQISGRWTVHCSLHCAGTRVFNDKQAPIEAWNRRPQSENKPLTLEQLRQMDGEPVWIVETPDWGHWELSSDGEDYLFDRDLDFYGMMYDDPAGRYGLHVLGWLAYRYKLEQEESNG